MIDSKVQFLILGVCVGVVIAVIAMLIATVIDDRRQARRRMAFEPAKGFVKDCAPMCGNCEFWKEECFAWGLITFCAISFRDRQADDECNVKVR